MTQVSEKGDSLLKNCRRQMNHTEKCFNFHLLSFWQLGSNTNKLLLYTNKLLLCTNPHESIRLLKFQLGHSDSIRALFRGFSITLITTWLQHHTQTLWFTYWYCAIILGDKRWPKCHNGTNSRWQMHNFTNDCTLQASCSSILEELWLFLGEFWRYCLILFSYLSNLSMNFKS